VLLLDPQQNCRKISGRRLFLNLNPEI